MPDVDSKSLVLAFYKRVFGEGRVEEIPRYIAETYRDHNAADQRARGPEVVKGHLTALRNTFPDFTIQTHEAVAEGDWVAVRVTAEGTHLGEWLGIKPSGKRVSLRGLNLDGVVSGQIVEHWGEADTIGMLIQMGVNPLRG